MFTFHIHLLFQFTAQFYSSQSSSPLYTHIAFNYFLPVAAGSPSASNHLELLLISSEPNQESFDFHLLPLHRCFIFVSLPRHHLLGVYTTFVNLMCHRHTLYFLRKNLCHFLSVLVTLNSLHNLSVLIGNSRLCLCTQVFIKSWSFTFLI